MLRLAYVTTHPVQYRAPLFRELARENDLTLKVFFGSDFGVAPSHDPGFDRTIRWDVPLLQGYEHVFIKNSAIRPNHRSFWGLYNPQMASEIIRWRPDVVIIHGYAHATHLMVLESCASKHIPVLIQGESNLTHRRSAFVRTLKRLLFRYMRSRIAGALAIGSLSAKYFEHYLKLQ